jgi:hypothetical protein
MPGMANKRASKKGRPYAAIGDRLERFRNEIVHVNPKREWLR